MAITIRDVPELQHAADDVRRAGKCIAVVPTMGFLHEGHLSLIRTARQHADIVITTVFVNPTQFGPSEDLERYPRNLERDVLAATAAGTDYVFAPDTKSLYPDGYLTFVTPDRLGSVLEGKSRPGHFRGVATIVAKLFNITKPHKAVFGQKDAQQVVVIRHMIRDLNFDIELIVVPTVREPDGLAMSSRNTYLSREERSQAPVLYQSLKLAEQRMRGNEKTSANIIKEMTALITSSSPGVIDYISIADANTLEELPVCQEHRRHLISLAVRFGKTRLIDNITVTL